MRIAALLACTAIVTSSSAACLSATRFTEVHLKDVERVDVEAPPAMKVTQEKGDVLVDGTSILKDPRWSARRASTVVRPVDGAPPALTLENGRYTWKRGPVVASTPRDNIDGAALATHWTQPMGVLPSLTWGVLGSAAALGFGVAGAAQIAEGASKGDDAALGEGIALSAAGAGGIALLTYGIVSFVLVQKSPFHEALDVVDAQAR